MRFFALETVRTASRALGRSHATPLRGARNPARGKSVARGTAPHPPSAPSPRKRGEGQQTRFSRGTCLVALLPATSGEKVPKADEGLVPRAKIPHKHREILSNRKTDDRTP